MHQYSFLGIEYQYRYCFTSNYTEYEYYAFVLYSQLKGVYPAVGLIVKTSL